MIKENNHKIKIVELFAGVGGFRLGFERVSDVFKTVWANQWEPGRISQYAYDCYKQRFGENHNCINKNISLVKNDVPVHDLLVGGFPCQDYSVAKTGAKGINGKKGALWWDIVDIAEKKRPKYILLENVDRLLKSPATQRGRDFGIILRGLTDLGYAIEWRVINAAEYGCAQRRRRTFIFAVHESTPFYNQLLNTPKYKVLTENGFFASEFKVNKNIISENEISVCDISKKKYASLVSVSEKFNMQFCNTGICIEGKIHTIETTPIMQTPITLNEICLKSEVDARFFLNGSTEKWQYLKGSKREPRVKPNGEKYFYTEGSMAFPDHMNMPSRTMLTSESSLNRSTHVIVDYKTKKMRLLTPIECERLNGFPDDWTNTGMPEKFRYFVMGNALVVPIIERIGSNLLSIINSEKVISLPRENKVLAQV
jgi:DNA (cytosine-5)-methyltransferase 1